VRGRKAVRWGEIEIVRVRKVEGCKGAIKKIERRKGERLRKQEKWKG
jgi:hypothetical protein